jgi:hypothetical protein
MTGTCKTCKWFIATWKSPQEVWSGNCRRHAPVRIQLAENNNGRINAAGEDGWPSVVETDFCGDFAERESTGTIAQRSESALTFEGSLI